MTKVLLTGATGFIGRHCLPLLKSRGYEIYAVSSKEVHSGEADVHWIQHDLLSAESKRELLSAIQPTHLLHLGWNVAPGKFWTASDNLEWLKKSIDLVVAFAQCGGKRVVAAGTCAEYDWRASEFSEGKTPCTPHTLYGSCKLALHVVLEALAKQWNFSQAWGRIFFLYGPHEYPQRFVPAVIRALLRQEAIPCSSGEQIRDFLHVEDVADVFVTLLDSQVEGAVNIGSGEGIALKEVIAHVVKRLGGEELVRLGALETPQGDPVQLVPTVERLKNELRWRPKYTVDEGLDQVIRWWEKHLNAV